MIFNKKFLVGQKMNAPIKINTLTGETSGEFHSLKILNGGTMTDILTLIGSGGGGGGGGTVTSAQSLLSISTACYH